MDTQILQIIFGFIIAGLGMWAFLRWCDNESLLQEQEQDKVNAMDPVARAAYLKTQTEETEVVRNNVQFDIYNDNKSWMDPVYTLELDNLYYRRN